MQQVQKDFIFFCGMLFIFTLLKFRKENIYETFLNGDKFRTRKERIVAYTMCKYIFEMVSEICPGCLCYCSAAHSIYFHYSFVDESLKSVQNRKILGDGFWTYLTFTMQMVLLMVTGMTLASVPFINRALQSVAKLADTPQKAYTMTFLISAIAYYINWGLAVVVGAIIAKEVAKRMRMHIFHYL